MNVNITDFDTPLWFYLPAAPGGVSGSILVEGHGVDWWPWVSWCVQGWHPTPHTGSRDGQAGVNV